MSQPSSELEFDAPEFESATESTYQPDAAPVQRYRKQGFSIYTVFLILSFVCLLVAMIILFVEAGKYT